MAAMTVKLAHNDNNEGDCIDDSVDVNVDDVHGHHRHHQPQDHPPHHGHAGEIDADGYVAVDAGDGE